MPKTSIRDTLLKRRRHLSVDTCLLWSRLAQQHLIAGDAFQQARTLALYSPINNEVFTEEVFSTARALRKRVFYPRVVGQHLEFAEVGDRSQLVHGRFGILEPPAGPTLPVADLDLLVLPGVAFDQSGHRLGYGKGFYDRTLHLADAGCFLFGLCFEFQRVAALPCEAHDVPMHFVVTETGTYPSQQPRPRRANPTNQGGLGL
ncbi:5-formyltetrahydrofolate cyclo-ligase [Geoalkalibacter sp.]|uniref:5-formyltetrahydrofolate cyclo-ligase n=1 Tax=Geoalkalibacter sp. TaxID=3041440 RepID=UPI00272E8710|nr:5-formyltetrahydrofolate cyclo-ligase [Geoalkalibacter sp.]